MRARNPSTSAALFCSCFPPVPSSWVHRVGGRRIRHGGVMVAGFEEDGVLFSGGLRFPDVARPCVMVRERRPEQKVGESGPAVATTCVHVLLVAYEFQVFERRW